MSEKKPYLPRMSCENCLKKLVALKRYTNRPCSVEEFIRKGLGYSSVGTGRTLLFCLKELSWVKKDKDGKYDISESGNKIARNYEIHLEDKVSSYIRESFDNIETLKEAYVHIGVIKKFTFEQMKEYIARNYGEFWNFKERELDNVTKNVISFLSYGRVILYNENEKLYELVETEPKEELEHVQLEEKIGHTPPRYIPEVRKRPYTITFNITITPETTKKDIEKMVKLVEEFTEEKTKEE